MSDHFSGFIEASGRATSTEQVFQLVCEAVRSLGFSMASFLALTAEAQTALTLPASNIPFLASNYPENYLRHYVQQRRYEIDPVLLLARDSLTPLIWRDVVDGITLSEEQSLLDRERREAGLYDEVTCPVHGPSAQTFAVCFGRDRSSEYDRAQLSGLQVLAIHFYYAFARVHETRVPSSQPMGLADGPPVSLLATCTLTHRERECLLWTARGKSASAISIILGLSENTINFYVKNAMKKLGTTNRVVAVVLAVRAGLIQP